MQRNNGQSSIVSLRRKLPSWACLIVGLAASASVRDGRAQVKAIISSEDEPKEVDVVRLIVSAAPEPKPALKYRLVPQADRIHGNAAAYVYKSMVFEGQDCIVDIVRLVNSGEILTWLEGVEPADLPRLEILVKVRWLTTPEKPFESLAQAARCDDCDWGDAVREKGIIQVPQAQSMRYMAHAIALKARLEIGDSHYDDAIDTLQVGYALTRNLSHSQTLVHNLIGMGIESNLDVQTRALIAAENSPNLYWALTDLATHPIDLREALSYESHIWEFLIHELADLEKRPFSGEKAASLADKVWSMKDEVRNSRGPDRNRPAPGDEMQKWAADLLPEAKTYLADHRYTAARIDDLPALQAVLVYRWKQYLELRDEYFKWTDVPGNEAIKSMWAAHDKIDELIKEGVGEPFALELPVIRPSLKARLRIQRKTELLRTVEALRMHAAENGGFPAKPEDITCVPVPVDPYTDKPFEYSGNGRVAIVSTPHGETWTNAAGAIRYQLELRQPAKSEKTRSP
jgi:hypothetical protein